MSTILIIKSPIVLASLLRFSLGVKVISARSSKESVAPTVSTVPDAKVNVPPEGIESTVIENESEVSPEVAMEKS